MAAQRRRSMQSIEGRQVNVALRDGTRIDDCNLVSSGRNGLDSLWLFINGADVIVALRDVVDVWETNVYPPRAA